MDVGWSQTHNKITCKRENHNEKPYTTTFIELFTIQQKLTAHKVAKAAFAFQLIETRQNFLV